jgi:allantoicase
MTIYPDGGVKRVRILGRKAIGAGVPQEEGATEPEQVSAVAVTEAFGDEKVIPVLPITPEAFSPFGKVVQGYGDHTAAPKGTKITPANAGTASKFHKLSLIESSYPADSGATSGLSIYRCQPLKSIEGKLTPLTVLERHSYTNQAFIPMGPGSGEGLVDPGTQYLVVVAQNGEDDKPDLKTLRAFIATAAQGIVYNTGIWRTPVSETRYFLSSC